MNSHKVAIVYDRVNKFGGAERVLTAIHEIFPDAPLFTSVCELENASWARIFPKIYTSFLQKVAMLKGQHEYLGIFMPSAFETFDFTNFDLVISVTSESAKGVITKPGTFHLCICLTPTRYLWSGYEEYLTYPPSKLKAIPFYKYISLPFLSYVRKWDLVAAQRPDLYVAISLEVKRRIKKYYNRDSEVIYPPVDVERFAKTPKKGVGSYYLIVSRLVPYKKVDLAIRAFNELGLPLWIVGIGSEESRLKRLAKGNIKFLGFVSDSELPKIYSEAIAFVNPQEEDFGMTVVEAQATGVPVIAYKKGGVLDTVIDGKTGILFDSQTKESLIKAVGKINNLYHQSNMFKNCRKNSIKFSKERFKSKFEELVEKVVSSQIE